MQILSRYPPREQRAAARGDGFDPHRAPFSGSGSNTSASTSRSRIWTPTSSLRGGRDGSRTTLSGSGTSPTSATRPRNAPRPIDFRLVKAKGRHYSHMRRRVDLAGGATRFWALAVPAVADRVGARAIGDPRWAGYGGATLGAARRWSANGHPPFAASRTSPTRRGGQSRRARSGQILEGDVQAPPELFQPAAPHAALFGDARAVSPVRPRRSGGAAQRLDSAKPVAFPATVAD